MSVTNCKVKYIRPKYNNLKEWMEDSQNVYIGRGGIVFIDKVRFPKKPSPFANPFKIGKDVTREEVINKYREYITDKLEKDDTLRGQLLEMRGKNLGCWCYPEKCHGDVLLELINKFV